MTFDLQKFAEDYARLPLETTYRGRNRLAGNYGRVYVIDDGESTDSDTSGADLIFEIKGFSATITAEREDVWIGTSKDSKVVGYSGEGEITIIQVFDRGYSTWADNARKGHDSRFTLIASLDDPDQKAHGEERVRIGNVWINELEIMKWEKGSIVEKTIPFGFTPYDLEYISSLDRGVSTTTAEQGA